MKITKISVYKTDLPYIDGSYGWGTGNAITVAKSTIIVMKTNAGLSGCGEFCPCGESYLSGCSEGVEAAAHILVPKLLARNLPGLGVEPDYESLGAPVATCGT